jgi:hypothetical protein
LFGEELLSALVEIGGWAGIDEENLSAKCAEFVGVELEVVGLTMAVGALIAGIAAENDQDDWSLCREVRESNRISLGCGEGKVRCPGSDGRGRSGVVLPVGVIWAD